MTAAGVGKRCEIEYFGLGQGGARSERAEEVRGGLRKDSAVQRKCSAAKHKYSATQRKRSAN